MKKLKLLSIFLSAYFITLNTVQPEFVFSNDDQMQLLHFQNHLWSKKRWRVNSARISPHLATLYLYLSCPVISNSQYSNLRKMLLSFLSDDEFIKVYNEIKCIRNWPESKEYILQVFQDNDYSRVKKFIADLNAEYFIRWYPYVAYHYDSHQRMHKLYRWMQSSEFNKDSHLGHVLKDNAEIINREIFHAPQY